MERFKFKLDALLKLREFKEKKIKVELGEIVQEIVRIKEDLKRTHWDLDEGYISQEKLLKSSTQARPVQFYAYYFDSKRNKIKELEKALVIQEELYENKRQELAKARGDVKVIERLKDKKEIEHNKAYEKKQQENLEELASIRRQMQAG